MSKKNYLPPYIPTPGGGGLTEASDKLRQELHRHPRMFLRDGSDICLAQPA